MIAAARWPASWVPVKSQFLRLWKAFHKRNYAQRRIMRSAARNRRLKRGKLAAAGPKGFT